MKREVDNLLYSVAQLCSDVETSTSGQAGAHRKTIARVRKNMLAVETVMKNEETTNAVASGPGN